MSSKRSFRRTFLCGAAIGALSLSGAAWAQDANTDDDVVEIIEETEAEARQEKVTVTGSLLRRDEFSSAAPIQVITADVARLEGLIDSASILQGSSIAAGSTQLNNQFGGFVVDGGTGVNTVDLRGCGQTRTLVLVNGKRPGPSGTQGAVGSFDLNNIPGAIVQSYELLKDSGSTIYGSDAVCGVVNIITQTSVDAPEINFNITQPFDSGGEIYSVDGKYGFNFDSGSIALSASYFLNEDLSLGDRDFLNCDQDLVTDPATGESFDRVNRSVTANGPTGRDNCGNIYFNTVLDRVFGDRLVPTPDGRVLPTGSGGTIPGYRPRENGVIPNSGGRSFYEDVLEDDRFLTQDAINKNEVISLYGVGDFDMNILGGVNSLTEVLYTSRQTQRDGWRQFFPDIRGNTTFFGGFFGYDGDPGYDNPLNTVALPVTLWPSNREVEVNYFLAQQTFSGDFGNSGFLADWAWTLGGNYSKSEGDYTQNQILASQTGDWSQFGVNGDYSLVRDTETGEVIVASNGLAVSEPIAGSGFAPTYNPFSASFLGANGADYDDAFATVGRSDTGTTEYEQFLINGAITGDLFEVPAGTVAAAFGFEYRDFSILDTPGDLSFGEIRSITETNPNTGLDETFDTRISDVWGFSTSGITEGSDSVFEVFTEVEVPILKGQKFAEELTLNVSGRAFDYESFGNDAVYKAQLNWQINPTLRLRATQGTSFRAPALFELFLANQTSFGGQFDLDPCIGDARRQPGSRVDQNCLADGIPAGFNNQGASATIIGAGNAIDLEPETSDSFTAGLVFTPSFADFNLALDYFEFEIDNQIAQLGAANILGACYGGEPDEFANNAFCDLFTRAPSDDAGAPFAIGRVQNDYINISKQTQRGLDLELTYTREFNFGTLEFDSGGTWTFESNTSLFEPGTVDGIEDNDSNGTIGDPDFVANARMTLERGDFRYNWFSDFVSRTSNERFADTDGGIGEPYFGALVNVDYAAEAYWEHGASVAWTGDTWGVTAGVRNLFDEAPPTLSAEAATARGNVPLNGTQYDLRGRRVFVNVSKTF